MVHSIGMATNADISNSLFGDRPEYERLGARCCEEWRRYRLTGEALGRFAAGPED